jgi:cobalt-zinc-cadmium efflux system outer membrane protein
MVCFLAARPCAVGRLQPGKNRLREKDSTSSRPDRRRAACAALGFAVLLTQSGCVLAPRATRVERERAAAAGSAYEIDAATRVLPPLPAEAGWRDILERAFLANGELEAAYFEWRAALARVDQAAAYPNTRVALQFQYMFSGENLKAWDRSSFNLGFDPMQSLSFPTKVIAAGRVALDEARAAGERFSAAKFDLQKRVLTAYWELVLIGERVRTQEAHAAVLGLLAETARARLTAGAGQRVLLDAEVARRLAENDLESLRAEVPQRRAELNALMGREAEARLPVPRALPAGREVGAGDAELLAVAVDRNPELAALARMVDGRQDALELARLQYIPDINPFAGFTGSMSQVAGAMLAIPATIPKVRAGIEEARADLRAAAAMLHQTERDRAGTFVATLHALRNSERQAAFLGAEVLPLAENVVTSLRAAYEAGAAGSEGLVESQRMLLDLRLAIAEARVSREQRLADLEALAGVDVETLAKDNAARFLGNEEDVHG